MFILANFLRLLGCLAEPYMPAFSAKLYEIMNVKYDEESLKYLYHVNQIIEKQEDKFLLYLIKSGQVFNESLPLFKTSKKFNLLFFSH